MSTLINKVCAYGPCNETFTQRTAWHKYCSDRCRLVANDAREQGIRKPQRAIDRGLCHCGCGRTRGKDLTLLADWCWRNGDDNDYNPIHI